MPARSLCAAVLASILLAPTVGTAQTAGLTLAQVESRYPRMNAVHIRKCDKNGDGIYTNAEMACVQGIYRSMYLAR